MEPAPVPRCQSCGTELEAGSNFCHACGDRVRPEPEPPRILEPEPEQQERIWRWWWVGAAFAALVVLGLLAALLRPENDRDGADAAPQTAAPTLSPSPDDVFGDTSLTALTLDVAGCPGCEIIAVPTDGGARQSATVPLEEGPVGGISFALPKAGTVGLSIMVVHPEGFTSAGGTNVVVLRPGPLAPGAPVTVRDVTDAGASGVCWAGTTAGAVALRVEVALADGGDGTPALLAWANPAAATIGAPAATKPDGSVGQQGLDDCQRLGPAAAPAG